MKRLLAGLTIAAAAAVGLSACSQFEQAAADELAHDVGAMVERRADAARLPTDDYAILAEALHEVVELDDADSDRYRPRHRGLEDADSDGVDDDGLIEIIVRHESSCLIATGAGTHVESGPC